MKLIFAGTPEFAAVALDGLCEAGFDVALVLTQPDRPGGRGMKLRFGPVKRRALDRGIPVAQPATLKVPALQGELAAIGADAMVVAAYGLLLPPAVLAIPCRGCVNIHASLLPRWRGAAPVQRALLAGDRHTGITIMQMEAGLDTGPILLQEAIAIEESDTAQTLLERLALLGASCIVRALRDVPSPRPQDEGAATYAAKISKGEARIDWSLDAAQICRVIRAFNPAPGATTLLDGEPLKLWSGECCGTPTGPPGKILVADANGIIVGAGHASVRIAELQRAGGKRLAAGAFIAGSPTLPGKQLGA